MDEQQKADLVKFQGNLELIAKTLDLSSHSVRSAFGRTAVFASNPDIKEQFLDVMETLNHLISSCKSLTE